MPYGENSEDEETKNRKNIYIHTYIHKNNFSRIVIEMPYGANFGVEDSQKIKKHIHTYIYTYIKTNSVASSLRCLTEQILE